MARISTFRDLIAWQKAMELAEGVHRACLSLPTTQRFEMGSQLRRSSTSVPSNIAEGFSRRSRGTYRHHVAIAIGSDAEVQTQLELCRRLELLDGRVIDSLVALALEVGRLLFGLWRSLTVKAVGYAVTLLAFSLGLGPGPWAFCVDFISSLNPEQREAVLHTDGPLLILAGAGSGKTRVITTRIAHLIANGHAAPGEVLAVTFTNKAAEEMRPRVEQLLGEDCRQIWLSTFHSLCARLLRREAPSIGLVARLRHLRLVRPDRRSSSRR